MDKFNRSYLLLIENNVHDFVTVNFKDQPFTLEFDIKQNNFSNQNEGQLRIFNLSKTTRSSIRKNFYDNQNEIRYVTLNAGYGSNMPLLFTGQIQMCSSQREGDTFVTTIEAFDGGSTFINGVTGLQFPAGTDRKTMIQALVKSMGITIGAMGSTITGKIPRGASLDGNPADLLRHLTGGTYYILNNKLYILADNECIEGAVTTISSDSGLLGTPRREESYLVFDMIFEPRLLVGQQIFLDSVTQDDQYNGFYKVTSIHHKGTISGGVSGSAITTIGLVNGSKELVTVPSL